MSSGTSDALLYLMAGAGATLVGLYFIGQRKSREVSFETLPNAPLLHKGEDICVWCGMIFPEPEDWFDAEHDIKYQQAMRPWVMQSYGNGRIPVTACCAQHMELWYMTGPAQRNTV